MEEQEDKKPTLINSAVKWGVINGVVGIVIVILAYVIDYAWLANWRLLVVALVIGLTIIIYGGIEYRKQNGGYLVYGKAWQHGFMTLLVSGLIGIVFNIILYSVIDPELPKKVTEVAMENAHEMMQNFGMQEGPDMDKAMVKAEADSYARMTPVGQIKNFAIGIIFYAIFASISAIFVKRNRPVDQM